MIVDSHNWKVQTTSTNDTWGTPIALYNTLNSLFQFTFDCCASEENKLCERYSVDIENETIDKDEILWCNPPYSRGVQARLTTHLIYKTTNRLVLLLPARPATKL